MTTPKPLAADELAELNLEELFGDSAFRYAVVLRMRSTLTQAHADLAREKARIESLTFAAGDAAELRVQLDKCATTFSQYADLHSAKNTPDGDAKAQANRVLAIECLNALAKNMVGAVILREYNELKAEITSLRSQLAREKARGDEAEKARDFMAISRIEKVDAEKDATISALRSRLAEAIKWQRTRGTIEVCERIGNSACANWWHKEGCTNATCPIKAARTQEGV